MSAIRQLSGLHCSLLLAVAVSFVVSGCGDRQEAAVQELYEKDYAFTVEEFFRAAGGGDLKAVRWFLDAGMDAAVMDVSHSQALHIAAASGGAEVVRELLEHGVDPSSERLDGRTPLMLAAASGDGRSVELLLNAGSSAMHKDSSGWSPLGLAAYGGFARAVEALVPLSRPHLNDALMLAAMGGDVGAIDHLVSAAAIVDVRSPDQRTPLMLAAARGHDDAVKFLLHHGANWYATDGGSRTASQLAAAGGHDGIVALLESAHLDDAERGGGDESFVPAGGEEAVLYSSRTRRLEGVHLVDSGQRENDLRLELHMLAYRERQLPILFEGDVDERGQVAEVRLLFGENEIYRLSEGDMIPLTHLEIVAIEQHWSTGKEGQGAALRSTRLVVREVTSGEVIGVSPGDPGRSAKSFALMNHESTGQIYEVRRGDRFEAMGGQYLIMDIRSSEVLIEDAQSGDVVSIGR